MACLPISRISAVRATSALRFNLRQFRQIQTSLNSVAAARSIHLRWRYMAAKTLNSFSPFLPTTSPVCQSELTGFRPLVEGEVKFYYCGPTVWDYGHIGNFRSAIAADVLRRYLKFKGLRVTQAMNITDVDDRIITKAQEGGKTIDDYTQKYIEAFWEDFDALGCERPEVAPRATRHIPDMVALIKKLMERDHAYQSDG